MKKYFIGLFFFISFTGIAQMNRSNQASNITSNVYSNGTNKITGATLQGVMINQNNSYVNLISDTNLLDIRQFSTSATYTPGMGAFYGDSLFMNLIAVHGPWVRADWYKIIGPQGCYITCSDTGSESSVATTHTVFTATSPLIPWADTAIKVATVYEVTAKAATLLPIADSASATLPGPKYATPYSVTQQINSSGTVFGSGAANEIAYWTGIATMSGSANNIYSDGNYIQLNSTSTNGHHGFIDIQSSNTSAGSKIFMDKSRGTLSSPLADVAGDTLSYISYHGYNGGFQASGHILSVLKKVSSSNTIAADMEFAVSSILGGKALMVKLDSAGMTLATPLSIGNGGTGGTSSGITLFNNITGYTAAGATGTTSTNIVFSTSPTLITPLLGTPTSGILTNCTGLPLTSGVTGILGSSNGGTGINNAGSTITIGGNFTMSGGYTFIGTLSANTAITFPTSGTLAITGTQWLLTGNTGTVPGTNYIGTNDGHAFEMKVNGVMAGWLDYTSPYQTLLGYQAGLNNTGISNTAIGFQALETNSSASSCVAMGYKSLFNNNGDANTGIGDSALYANSSGVNNTAIGYQAMSTNSTGGNNVAIGYQANKNATSTGDNVSVGVGALQSESTSGFCTAIGYHAMIAGTASNNCVSLGYLSMSNITSSGAQKCTSAGVQSLTNETANNIGNCAYGYYSSGSIFTTGDEDIFIGDSSGQGQTSGSFCTYVGSLTTTSSGTVVNAMGLGYQAKVTSSNSIVLGNPNSDSLRTNAILCINNATTSVNSSTSGSVTFAQDQGGTAYKHITIYCNAALGAASYTFPIAFQHTPGIVVVYSGAGTITVASTVVTALSTTAVTITGTTSTGYIFLEGN